MQETLKIVFETDKMVLSNISTTHKTEKFVKLSSRFKSIDFLLAKLSEGIVSNLKLFSQQKHADSKQNVDECFEIELENGLHKLFFKFGFQMESVFKIQEYDLIFFNLAEKEVVAGKNDLRFELFLKGKKQISMNVTKVKSPFVSSDFSKLYRLSNSNLVNFPLLNQEQEKIVNIENQNILVQGVAGSGKTNVCIDKIVFVACRNYTGKILYTTFSRGLLIDTKNKVEVFKKNVKEFLQAYENGMVEFADSNHKSAIEKKLGIYFPVDEDEQICVHLNKIIDYLEKKVDYFLIEDLANLLNDKREYVGETYFVKKFLGQVKNHQLTSKLQKLKNLSYEVIYKEIYGVIFGCYDIEKPAQMLSLDDYVEKRQNSFSRQDCETIWQLAEEFLQFSKAKGLSDNNFASRMILENQEKFEKYSLTIIDEVQDMTEVNLCMLKSISRKMFCVGDALQMINPSYFSFAFLKRLLYEKELTTVAELENNYRSTKKITTIIDNLSNLNKSKFGTHSFVLNGKSIDKDTSASTIYVHDVALLKEIQKHKLDQLTIIVSGAKEKEELRKCLDTQEILTVSEAKGLERKNVLLANLLSDNIEKWNELQRISINRKQSDENSVYRYYFNLLYVGMSRAKQNLFVVEKSDVEIFKNFFKDNFETLTCDKAIKTLEKVVGKKEIELEDLLLRIEEFIRLEQFDNARFAIQKIENEILQNKLLKKVEVHEHFVSHGKYRDAGIEFWKENMFDEAKEQFVLSGDKELENLVDACLENNGKGLGIEILKFFDEMKNNDVAKKLIFDVLNVDFQNTKAKQNQINEKFRKLKENSRGKQK